MTLDCQDCTWSPCMFPKHVHNTQDSSPRFYMIQRAASNVLPTNPRLLTIGCLQHGHTTFQHCLWGLQKSRITPKWVELLPMWIHDNQHCFSCGNVTPRTAGHVDPWEPELIRRQVHDSLDGFPCAYMISKTVTHALYDVQTVCCRCQCLLTY